MGVGVVSRRYVYTLVGGALAGVGGAYLSLGYTPTWVEGMTAGRGWIAIGLVVFGTWDPLRVMAGADFFGFFVGFQRRPRGVGRPNSSFVPDMPAQLFTGVRRSASSRQP